MAVILQLHLCLYKLKGSMIYVDDCLLPKNVMLPLSTVLHDGMHLLIIGGVFQNYIGECLTMIGH